MNALLTRRHVVAGLGLLSLGLLAGCDPGSGLSYKYGKDLSNENTPMTIDTLKQVVDDLATDATVFDTEQK